MTQSGNKQTLLNFSQQSILLVFIALMVISVVCFKNIFFKSSLLLKNFGESSIDPEIAFTNNKPTFLEFYAEWCEVCKEMAPKVSDFKKEYEADVNFVFLNVDNQKWEKYIRKFDVNGIPQINIFDNQGNLEKTFLGKQDENIIRNTLENINDNLGDNLKISSKNFSTINENNNYQISPRSHG